ncbi:MAG: hypothetical protein Q4A42_06780 [Tissierellia bacterium]|nr:hypothetical protein [Tissierellia bacterium]
MILQELVLINRGKYDRVFLANMEESLKDAELEEIFEHDISEKGNLNAKDYYLLDKEGMEDIFLQANRLNIQNELCLVVLV